MRPYLFYSVNLQHGSSKDEYERTEFLAKNKPVPPGLSYGKSDPGILDKLKQPEMLDQLFKLLAKHYPPGSERNALPPRLAEFRDANFVRALLLPPGPKASIEVSYNQP